jgi:hypothetical protein
MAGVAGRSGGARPGAGRKPGSGVIRHGAKTAVALASKLGTTPLEVLLTQMASCQERAAQLRDDMQRLIDTNIDGVNTDQIERTKVEITRLLEMARVRAVDASPYVHAKLASVAVQAETKTIQVQHTIKIIADALDEAARAKVAGVDLIEIEATKPSA